MLFTRYLDEHLEGAEVEAANGVAALNLLVTNVTSKFREAERLLDVRSAEASLGSDKVKVARRQFRGQGLYIDEVLS